MRNELTQLYQTMFPFPQPGEPSLNAAVVAERVLAPADEDDDLDDDEDEDDDDDDDDEEDDDDEDEDEKDDVEDQ